LRVVLERLGTLLASVTGHLVASEGRVRVVLVPGVDPDCAGLNLVGQPQGSSQILCLDARGEAVSRVVSDADRFFLVFKGNDRQHGAEDFLPRYLEVVGCVREKRGLDEQALAVDLLRAASRGEPRARLLARFNVGENPNRVWRNRTCRPMCVSLFCPGDGTSQVRIVSRPDVEELLAGYPVAIRHLLDLVSERFVSVLMDLDATSFRQLIPRLAGLLLRRADGNVVRNVTHKELAQHLHVYRESATAALGELKKAGIIKIEQKQIQILHRWRLERAARE
jgi:Crp-like helix-turn-helix domain